jgi:integrative and conjugative element protein (TIGR02256 family)
MNNRYRISKNECLELSERVTSSIHGCIQAGRRKEAGGILLGTVYPRERVLITDITVPGRFDKAGFYFFDRSRKRAQRIVNSCWKRSTGECIYLGEWHTHAEAVPSPSSRDRAMIRNMFKQTEMEIEFLFLIVVGLESVWIGIENGRELLRLEPIFDKTHPASSLICPILT